MSAIKEVNNTPVTTYRWLKVNTGALKDVELKDINLFVKRDIQSSDGVTVNRGENTALNYVLESSSPVNEDVRAFVKHNCNDNLNIDIKENTKLQEPVVIRYNLNNNNKYVVNVNKITFNRDSEGTIIFVYDGVGNHIGRTEVICEDGARAKVIKVNLLKDESLEISELISEVRSYGSLEVLNINLGENKQFDNVNINLKEKAVSEINSLYLGAKNDEIDINYVVNHLERESQSDMKVRGALLDSASKTFRGTIDFKRGSSRSKGKEEEYVMLLSPKVKNKAMPLLLCDEDDVSGEHAAASGRIDENKLFYLMSRGLSEKESKKLIIEGNFTPILDKVNNEELVDEIYTELKGRLINE